MSQIFKFMLFFQVMSWLVLLPYARLCLTSCWEGFSGAFTAPLTLVAVPTTLSILALRPTGHEARLHSIEGGSS